MAALRGAGRPRLATTATSYRAFSDQISSSTAYAARFVNLNWIGAERRTGANSCSAERE